MVKGTGCISEPVLRHDSPRSCIHWSQRAAIQGLREWIWSIHGHGAVISADNRVALLDGLWVFAGDDKMQCTWIVSPGRLMAPEVRYVMSIVKLNPAPSVMALVGDPPA